MKQLMRNGFTLIEVLVALGILTIGVLVTLSATSIGIKSQKNFESLVEADSVMSIVQLIIGNSESCTLNFKDKVLDTSLMSPSPQTNSDFGAASLKISLPRGAIVAQQGMSIGMSQIDSMSLVLDGKVGNTYFAKLTLSFVKKLETQAKSVGASQRTRTIPVAFFVDSGTGKVKQCGGGSSGQTIVLYGDLTQTAESCDILERDVEAVGGATRSFWKGTVQCPAGMMATGAGFDVNVVFSNPAVGAMVPNSCVTEYTFPVPGDPSKWGVWACCYTDNSIVGQTKTIPNGIWGLCKG